MPLTLTVPDDIACAARERAGAYGRSPEEVLLEALETAFAPLPIELQREFDAWNRASDADMDHPDVTEGVLGRSDTDGPR